MSTPTVSVIFPCYNAHALLGRALDSVRSQTCGYLEMLVVNDGSTDPDTVAFLAALPQDVRVVHQENRGLSGARNTGFREARGELVLPLDCDDWIAPTFLEKALAVLSGSQEKDAFVFAYLALEGDAVGPMAKNFNFFEQLFANQLPYCLLLNKSLWEQVGGYDESMRKGYEDWDFNIRLGRVGAVGLVIPEPLFHYRVSADGMLLSVSRQRHGVLWRQIQEKYPELYGTRSLWRLWRRWRGYPSTRPLWLYACLLMMHRMLPEQMFTRLFEFSLRFSQSRPLRRAE
jgi:glycosyltransferase involved in cell wall biosynthesis